MQKLIHFIAINVCTLLLLQNIWAIPPEESNFSEALSNCLKMLEKDIALIRVGHRQEKWKVIKRISEQEDIIKNSKRKRKILRAVLVRNTLNDSLRRLIFLEEMEVSKVRFLKGIQIIKILYDRILALDHHYTSLHTIQSIQRMSNPNNYPSYIKARERIIKKLPKKSGFDLTDILRENLHTNIMYSILSLFSSTNTLKKDKREELKNMECIIDFTLRLNGDLNTIHYEMQFLKNFNEESKVEIERLFEEYVSPLVYEYSLEESKSGDKWQSIKKLVENRIESITEEFKRNPQLGLHQDRINDLKFSIDQLYFFIHRYRAQTTQSVNFYQKFKIMLDSYENAQLCRTEIPEDFLRLKANIDLTISKFQKAYSLGELRGSKLKQLLYGVSTLN